MTSTSDEKWQPFSCFSSQVGLRTYQHPCTVLFSVFGHVVWYHPGIANICSAVRQVTKVTVSLKNLGPHSVTGEKGQWEGHTRGNETAELSVLWAFIVVHWIRQMLELEEVRKVPNGLAQVVIFLTIQEIFMSHLSSLSYDYSGSIYVTS